MFSERMQLLLTPQLRQRLRAEAKRRGTSEAAIAREALEAKLGTVSRDDRLAAIEAIGAMHGAPLEPEELDALIAGRFDDDLDRLAEQRRR